MSPMPFDVERQLRRHGAALRELAGEIVRDPWLADDAAQEVWLGALRRPPPHETAVGGWLATALRNVVRGLRRKERRLVRREREVAAARGEVGEDHAVVLAREEQAQRLLAAVTTLASPFREAIWQRYFEGKAPRQIAASSGVPCATVKSRLQRGLQQLRSKLDEEGAPGWRSALAVAFGWPGTAVPAAGAAMTWTGVLLMTIWTKSLAAVAVVSIAGVLWWSQRDPGMAPPGAGMVGPETATVATATVATASAAAAAADRPDAAADVGDERTLLTPDVPAVARSFREVRVENEAGEPVAGATVMFVKPGFDYGALPHAQANLYSRSTETWLRDFGLAEVTDAIGRTRIPIAAADCVVVARKGYLYGTNWPRSSGEVQQIVVRSHHTLVVETVDASGTPVPRITVMGERVAANGERDPMSQWTLGTTDDRGMLTQVLEAPTGANPTAQILLHAELLDGPHGQQTIDAVTPPTFVRIVLPALGTVRAKIQNADGSPLAARTIEALHAELSIVGARPSPSLQRLSSGTAHLRYVPPDAEGVACFEHIVLGRTVQLRFPGMLITTKEYPGPGEAERVVTIVQTIAAEHPFVVGTLVDPDGRPIGNATFTIIGPNEDLMLAVGSKTDAHGRFLTGLTERCIGQRGVVLSFGIRDGAGASQIDVTAPGPLLGKVELGTVVMPHAK